MEVSFWTNQGHLAGVNKTSQACPRRRSSEALVGSHRGSLAPPNKHVIYDFLLNLFYFCAFRFFSSLLFTFLYFSS